MKYKKDLLLFIVWAYTGLIYAQTTHHEPDTTGVFTRYTQVKQLVQQWNQAITTNQPQMLMPLYADTVQHYLKRIDKKACVDSKINWLDKHPGYQQKIENLEVYYLDTDTLGILFIADFTKVCIDKGKTVKVPSYLYFQRDVPGWKIIRETDHATEATRAKAAPTSSLPQGETSFYYGYWTDTRDDENFAHDEVPYSYTLNLKVGKTITGEYLFYSGRLRGITYYLIPEGKVEEGILEITLVYNENGWMTLSDYHAEDYSDAYREHWHFKIVNGNELVNIDKDSYMYGMSLYLTK